MIIVNASFSRPHSTSGCYQTGSMIQGALVWTNGVSKACASSPPPNVRTWFNVKVVVSNSKDTVEIYLDDKLVTDSQRMNLERSASGGIVVANGFENIVRFKNLKVEAFVEEINMGENIYL